MNLETFLIDSYFHLLLINLKINGNQKNKCYLFEINIPNK